MLKDDCLFCSIVSGTAESRVVADLEGFLVIENKFPKAPIHVLVLDKQHTEKSDTISGDVVDMTYWGKFFRAVSTALDKVGLGKNGQYELVINGPSYAHFQHQHVHIMGGYADGKGART